MGFMRDIGNGSFKRVRESVNDHQVDAFFEGYDEAATVCMHAVEARVEELHSRINDGYVLTEKEQFLLAQLSVLKKEMDDALQSSIKQKNS